MTRMRTAEELGAAIAALRKQRKMTQQDLADKLGANRVTVANWEIGKFQPDDKVALAAALGVSLQSLVYVDEVEGGVYRDIVDDLERIAMLLEDIDDTTVIASSGPRVIVLEDGCKVTGWVQHTMPDRERGVVADVIRHALDIIELCVDYKEDHGTSNNTQATDAER